MTGMDEVPVNGAVGSLQDRARASDTVVVDGGDVGRRPGLGMILLRGILLSRSGRFGLVLLTLVLVAVIVGRFIQPHSPTEVVGLPFAAPNGDALLGTDYLGRDVLSRFLSGGTVLVMVALLSPLAAYVVGGGAGLVAGYRRGVIDMATIGVTDVFLAIPPIVFALVLVAGLGSGPVIIAAAVALVQVPPVARLVRAATMSISSSEYVEAAVARGERTVAVVLREVLPNLRAPILADFGVRVSWTVILFASLGFLGFGRAPPAADWGVMISENRDGLTLQPWPVLVPAAAIAALAIAVNLIADALARSIGRTVVTRGG